MQLSVFAQFLERLEKTSLRNEMTVILAELFNNLSTAESRAATHLLLGELDAPYKKNEFNIGEKLLLKVIAFTFGKNLTEIKNKFKSVGDVGTVGEAYAPTNKKSMVTVNEAYNTLLTIAQTQGGGSVEKKVLQFAKFLQQLDPLAIRYILRMPVGKLRLGFSDMTLLDALSYSVAGDKSLRPIIEEAFNLSCDIGLVVETFKKGGVSLLQKIDITPGIPVRMAGAERLGSPIEIFEKLGSCAIEPKYDGFRVQVHKFRSGETVTVKIFSRNLEDTSAMFPDITAEVLRLPLKEIIFEGEAVGVDKQTGKLLPFQETIQRKRKHDVSLFSQSIPLKVFAYDVLYYDGEELWKKNYQRRRADLENIFSRHSSPMITPTKQDIAEKSESIEKLFHKYVTMGLEGIIAKKLDAPYRAGKRSFNWVKFKKTMEKKLADTFDCMVMGYYVGKGKRSQFGIGAFLVGVFDKNVGQWVTVAKIGTGVKDDEWVALKKSFTRLAVKEKPSEYNIPKELTPDFFVTPKIIVEVGADEITESPLHTAAYALRFPRLLVIRSDKSPQEATTVKELVTIFQIQRGTHDKT